MGRQRKLDDRNAYNKTLEEEYDQSQKALEESLAAIAQQKQSYEKQLKSLTDVQTKEDGMDQQVKKLERINYEQMQQVKELTLSIEMLKHQKLMLEEWKTEIGQNALNNVETLQIELE